MPFICPSEVDQLNKLCKLGTYYRDFNNFIRQNGGHLSLQHNGKWNLILRGHVKPPPPPHQFFYTYFRKGNEVNLYSDCEILTSNRSIFVLSVIVWSEIWIISVIFILSEKFWPGNFILTLTLHQVSFPDCDSLQGVFILTDSLHCIGDFILTVTVYQGFVSWLGIYQVWKKE